MRFYRAASHVQLLGNVRVIASLKQKLHDLLLTSTQTNCLFAHGLPPILIHHRLQPGVTARPDCMVLHLPLLNGLFP